MDFKRYSKYILPALIYAIVLTACDPHRAIDPKYRGLYRIKNHTLDTLKIWTNSISLFVIQNHVNNVFHILPDSNRHIFQSNCDEKKLPFFFDFLYSLTPGLKDSIVIFSLKGEKLCEWDEDGRNLPGKQFYKESSWKKRVWEKEEKSYYEWTFEINPGDISKSGE